MTTKKPKEKKPRAEPFGRPTKYCAEMVTRILELACRGKTQMQIADEIGINYDTITEWQSKYADFSVALKKSKEISDEEVEATLRMKALGYTRKAAKFWYDKDAGVITEEYEEYYPPDTTAQIFWLKNRQRDRWRDKVETEHSGSVDTAPQVIITLPDNKRSAKPDGK